MINHENPFNITEFRLRDLIHLSYLCFCSKKQKQKQIELSGSHHLITLESEIGKAGFLQTAYLNGSGLLSYGDILTFGSFFPYLIELLCQGN